MDNSIKLDDFFNPYTLNIFSDASMDNNAHNGCYGVVAVCGNTIIDSVFNIVSGTTNNNSELKGIRAAISMAYKYKNNYKKINIFSDSKISISGLTDYIYKWNYNPNDQLLYTKSTGQPAANQFVFIETFELLKNLRLSCDIPISLYHQSGHVKDNFSDIKHATSTFSKINNIYVKIDYNFIRYISSWNNYVDNTSRSTLRNFNFNNMEYIDPIEFVARGKIAKY